MQYEIISIGGGELLEKLFNGIALTMGESAYTSMIRLAVILGVGVTLWGALSGSHIKAVVTWFGKIMLVSSLLVVPKSTVHIRDVVAEATGGGQAYYSVANVPTSLGALALLSSNIGYGLAQLYEKNISTVHAASYSSTGMLFGARLIAKAASVPITNPRLDKNLKFFMVQCIFPEMMHNNITVEGLMTSGDLWEFFKKEVSPVRSFLYEGPVTKHAIDEPWVSPRGRSNERLETCNLPEILNEMEATLNAETADSAPSKLASILGLPTKGPSGKDNYHAMQTAAVMQYLPSSYNYLLGLSTSGSQIVQQAFMRDMIQEGIMAKGAQLSSAAMIDSFTHIKAGQMNALSTMEQAYEARAWIPQLNIILLCLVYGFFPAVVLMLFLGASGRILKMYIQIILWLQLWPVGFAMVNSMVNWTMIHAGQHIADRFDGILSLQALSMAQDTASHAIILANKLLLVVPGITGAFVFGSVWMLTSVAGGALSQVQSSGEQALHEAASGNIQLGNAQLDTQSMASTQGYKIDSNVSQQAGQTAMQSASGAGLNFSRNGGFSVQSGTSDSHLSDRVNISDAARRTYSNRYEHSVAKSEQASMSYADAVSAQFRDMVDISHHLSDSHNHDDTYTVGDTYSANASVNDFSQEIHRFAENHKVSDDVAVSVLGRAYAGANLGLERNVSVARASGSLGVNTSIEGMSKSDYGKMYDSAVDLSRNSNFNELYEQSSRAVQENHFRGSFEGSDRLTDDVSSNIEIAKSSHHQYEESLHEAQTAARGLQYTHDNAVSIDKDETQKFVEWLAHQKMNNGSVMGAQRAEEIINHKQSDYDGYLDEYVSTTATKEIIELANATVDGKTLAIKDEYEIEEKANTFDESVLARHEADNAEVLSEKGAVELNEKALVEDGVGESVRDKIDEAKFNTEEKLADSDAIQHVNDGEVRVNRKVDEHRGHLTKHAVRGAKKATLSTIYKAKKPYENKRKDEENE